MYNTTQSVSAGGWLLTVRYIRMKQDEKVYRRALAADAHKLTSQLQYFGYIRSQSAK